MKLLLAIFLVSLSTIIFSCKDGDATAANSTPSASDNPSTLSTTSTGSVEHYTCPNGHVGSGGATAGLCSECSATLEHNAAFHNTPQPADQAAVNPDSNPEAYNTSVEHYICPNGHVGSGGTGAGSCSECGATLDHNTAYHNDPPPTDQAAVDLTDSPELYNTNVEHYICPNGHEGSGGAGAGSCSNCGATLEHNAAYHNDPAPTNLANQIDPNTASSVPPVSSPPLGVEHYICPNGHTGSGGAAQGICAQCSAALLHNDAFHSNDVQNVTTTNPLATTPQSAPTITPQPSGAVSPVFQNNPVNIGGNVFPNAPGVGTSAEPAQNAGGVWHYTCTTGCAGGGGSAVACSVCGRPLVHNTLYHG